MNWRLSQKQRGQGPLPDLKMSCDRFRYAVSNLATHPHDKAGGIDLNTNFLDLANKEYRILGLHLEVPIFGLSDTFS